jgi:adenosylcobinamide-phosphate synthase
VIRIAVLVAGLFLDRIVGDPRTSLHPVALLGRFIGMWGQPQRWTPSIQRWAGVMMWLVTTVIFAAPFALFIVYAPWYLYLLAAPFLLKVCFSWRALEEHASAVEVELKAGSGGARQAAARLVSRDTSDLSDEQVRSATYESVSENLVDSITAPLFWFGICGLTGAAVFRAANTMDAMLGYRDEREHLGWFAARADDLLCFIPARLTGAVLLVWFACRGRFSPAWRIYRRDRHNRPGFNGGIPMAIIAGGTGVQFEKPGVYRIGDPGRPLAEAGSAIITAIRAGTVIFSAFVILALLLLHLLCNS